MNNNLFQIENINEEYIEIFAREFIDRNICTINNLCFSVFGEKSKLSLSAFQEIVFGEIKKACFSFVNNSHDPKYIDSYLFSCIHRTIKGINNENKSSVLICPGCKYFSRIEILDIKSKKLHCNICRNSIDKTSNQWEETLYKTFFEHTGKGYRCPECENFIPDRNTNLIRCPYPDCFFVGDVATLSIMRHPSVKANLEIPSLNRRDVQSNKSTDEEMIVNDDIRNYLKILNEIIDSQVKLLQYKSNASTLKNKQCMYAAYKSIIDKYPEEMVSYLVFRNRNIKIQHRIFQEFVKILELSLPFSFKKNKEFFEIKSIDDENLCIFSGDSEFIASVDNNHEIPNLTKELYVGSRKGTYCRPYYIGKVLDIVNIDLNISIIDSMSEFYFYKIIMKNNIAADTRVLVKHKMIFPHYQMGAMVYLNRIRRTIVDKVYFILNGHKRVIKC